MTETTQTPTPEQIAETVDKCRRLADPNQDGGNSVGHLWNALDEAADLIEALAAQLAEAQESEHKRLKVLAEEIAALRGAVEKAEAAAASARETVLTEAIELLHRREPYAGEWREQVSLIASLKSPPVPAEADGLLRGARAFVEYEKALGRGDDVAAMNHYEYAAQEFRRVALPAPPTAREGDR